MSPINANAHEQYNVNNHLTHAMSIIRLLLHTIGHKIAKIKISHRSTTISAVMLAIGLDEQF